MTNKNPTPDTGSDTPTTPESTPSKPPIGKTTAAEVPEIKDAPAPKAANKAKKAAPVEPVQKPVATADVTADKASMARKSLLEVDSYDEAEVLLSKDPTLVEDARTVFGAIVPTMGQNEFIDLAIMAAADDDVTTLGEALQKKRKKHINLTSQEASQLLEFAGENVKKSPKLALYIAILSTDDLTHLQDANLWQTQKSVVMTTGDTLGVDAMTIWEEINGTGAPKKKVKVEKQPKPKKVKTKTAEPTEEKKRPAPPPPVRMTKQKKYRWSSPDGGPPRWAVASGFVFLMTMMSCGVCFLGAL